MARPRGKVSKINIINIKENKEGGMEQEKGRVEYKVWMKIQNNIVRGRRKEKKDK